MVVVDVEQGFAGWTAAVVEGKELLAFHVAYWLVQVVMMADVGAAVGVEVVVAANLGLCVASDQARVVVEVRVGCLAIAGELGLASFVAVPVVVLEAGLSMDRHYMIAENRL